MGLCVLLVDPSIALGVISLPICFPELEHPITGLVG